MGGTGRGYYLFIGCLERSNKAPDSVETRQDYHEQVRKCQLMKSISCVFIHMYIQRTKFTSV